MITQDQPAKNDLGTGQAFALGGFGFVAETADSFLDLPLLVFELFNFLLAGGWDFHKSWVGVAKRPFDQNGGEWCA